MAIRNVIETIKKILDGSSLSQLGNAWDGGDSSIQHGSRTEQVEREIQDISADRTSKLELCSDIFAILDLPNEDEMNLTSPSKSKIKLQQKLESLAAKETLQLFPANGEYEAPITIDRPLTLDGQGATIWAKKGPVVSVRSDGVCLQNLRIEVTGESKDSCAIFVATGYKPQIEEVEVRGNIIGIAGEEGDWNYPLSLNLGQLAYGYSHNFILRIIVPIACKIEDNISGLEFAPRQLQPGANEIHLNLERVPQDTLIYGHVFLISPTFKRRIAVNARVIKLADRASTSTQGKIIWEAEGWSNHKVEIQKKTSAELEKPKTVSPAPQQPKPPLPSTSITSTPYPTSQLLHTPKAPRIKRNQTPPNSSWAISVPERYANVPKVPATDRDTDTSPKIAAIFAQSKGNLQENYSTVNCKNNKQLSDRKTNSKASDSSRTTSLPVTSDWPNNSISQSKQNVKQKRENSSIPQHFLAAEAKENVKSEPRKPQKRKATPSINPLFES